MALPVAPLGQLPSMNMPYSRPYYEKSSAVDKALTAFLTGMMANIGSQAAENAMQRDFAADPAGFFSKLVQGPKQNRQQFEAQTARSAEEAALQKQLSSREQIAEADRRQRAGEVDRRFEDSERDRAMRMSLGDLEMQQRSQQAQYQAEQQRRMAEFMAGNELTQIDRRADAQMRAAGAAGKEELAMRKALLEAEYGLKSKLAGDEAARWGLGVQPGQQQTQPTGRRELTEAEQRAMQQPAGRAPTAMDRLNSSPLGQIGQWVGGKIAGDPYAELMQKQPAQVPSATQNQVSSELIVLVH